MRKSTDRRVQAEVLAGWFREQLVGEYLALTLTFQPPRGFSLDQHQAQETLRHFFRRLEQRVFGKAGTRFGRHIQRIAVLEGAKGALEKHLHYHLQVEIPLGFLPNVFGELCKEVWSQLDWASKTQNRYEYCTPEGGWTSYILKDKRADKPDYLGSIDFGNTRF